MLFIFSLISLAILLINPWLLARNLLPRSDFPTTLAAAGACLVALTTGSMVILHLSHIPITAASLVILHGTTAFILLILTKLRSISPRMPIHQPIPFYTMILLFGILVLPFTPIAGRDTYKYQDLATVVQVEQSIPWLIHPLSLLGFTPRSYASAQPLLLAAISILGNTGVDWSFYILSLLCGVTAIAATTALGRRLFPDHPESAIWLAFFYVFSTVFLRYNFWAIGRGLFMTLLPLFVLGLLTINRLPGLVTALATAPLLAGSHKTGGVAIVIIPLIFLSSLVSHRLPLIGANRRWRVILPAVLLLLALATGFLIVNHSLPQAVNRIATRLAFLFPLAIAGAILIPCTTRISPSRHAMTLAAIVTLPLVFTDYMYGTLIATLFFAYLATQGVTAISARLGACGQSRLNRTAIAITLMIAVTLIIHQSSDSPSRDVVRAAKFIEQHNPLGPFRLEAPGPTRPRMQAYLSGCPRFSATASSNSTVNLQPPPSPKGILRDDVKHLSDYLRSVLTLADSSTDWYGSGDKVYYVTVNGQGRRPSEAKLLFSAGNVSVYE